MAKRSGRDRDRDAARKVSRGDVAGERGNRRPGRELGRLQKRLDRARSAEAKRLRQLDEAAAEVVRLEAELRRLESGIAGHTGKVLTGSPPAPASDLAARAAGLEAELARLEAPPASPVFPPDVAMLDELEPAEVPGGWPEAAVSGEDATQLDGEVAEPAAEAEAALLSEAPAAMAADEAQPAMAEDESAPARPEEVAWTEAPEIEPPDEWPDVIHLGAGSADIETASDERRALPVEPEDGTPETPGVDEAPWTTGAGLPFRPGRRNGSGASSAADAGASDLTASPDTARREAEEAPEPTARSWPQRSWRFARR